MDSKQSYHSSRETSPIVHHCYFALFCHYFLQRHHFESHIRICDANSYLWVELWKSNSILCGHNHHRKHSLTLKWNELTRATAFASCVEILNVLISIPCFLKCLGNFLIFSSPEHGLPHSVIPTFMLKSLIAFTGLLTKNGTCFERKHGGLCFVTPLSGDNLTMFNCEQIVE